MEGHTEGSGQSVDGKCWRPCQKLPTAKIINEEVALQISTLAI